MVSISGPKKPMIEINVSLQLIQSSQSISKTKILSFQFISGTSAGAMIDSRKISVSKIPTSFTLKSFIKNESDEIICSLICNEVVGLDVVQSVIPQSVTTDCNYKIIAKADSFDRLLELDQEKFWENIDMSLLDGVVSVPSQNLAPQSKVASSFEPCKHSCKDKNICRHLCCREGVPVKNSKRRKLEGEEEIAQRKPEKKIVTMKIEDDLFPISSGSISWDEMVDFDCDTPSSLAPSQFIIPPTPPPLKENPQLNIKDLKSAVYSSEKSKHVVKTSGKKRTMTQERQILDSLSKNVCKSSKGQLPSKSVAIPSSSSSVIELYDEISATYPPDDHIDSTGLSSPQSNGEPSNSIEADLNSQESVDLMNIGASSVTRSRVLEYVVPEESEPFETQDVISSPAPSPICYKVKDASSAYAIFADMF